MGGRPPATLLPSFIADIPRPLVVGGALGLWQSIVLWRWLKGGGDWWLPTSVGVIVGSFLASHLTVGWTVAALAPGSRGHRLRDRRRPVAHPAPVAAPQRHLDPDLPRGEDRRRLDRGLAPLLAGHQSPPTQLLLGRGLALVGLALTDGWLLGSALRGMLGPGNYRGPKLRFPS